MFGHRARNRSGLNKQLRLRSLIRLRFASSFAAFFFLSVSTVLGGLLSNETWLTLLLAIVILQRPSEDTGAGHGQDVQPVWLPCAMDAELDRDVSCVSEVRRSVYPISACAVMLTVLPSSGLALEVVLTLIGPCYLLFFSVLWAIGESRSFFSPSGLE
jgi:hypothetical protein